MEVNLSRRHFLRSVALSGGPPLLLGQQFALARENSSSQQEKLSALPVGPDRNPVTSPRELTVAGFQLIASKDVKVNEESIHRAIDKAAGLKVDFLLTPEGSLSGYYPDFDRVLVHDAAQRIALHAKEARVGLLLGTCYKELDDDPLTSLAATQGLPTERREYCYDQIRVHAPNGEFLGAYSKILLCSSIYRPGTGEMRDYVAGTLRTFQWEGICFGTLICNDLWATPGFTITPNPYLAWRLKTMGAQVIFHSVATAGTPLFFRPYHESNQSLWARMLQIPIVTTNLNDGTTPSNCRAGIIGPDGERVCVAHELGEQFFSCTIKVG